MTGVSTATDRLDLPGVRAGWALSLLALLYILWRFAAIALEPGLWQWDFRVYHLAAQAFLLGEDPYSLESLRRLAPNEEVNLRFIYPPWTLYAFAPFGWLDAAQAKWLWLAIKAGSLAGMAALWMKTLVRREHAHWLAVFALLVFNGSWSADLHTGNAALVEQALLWLAFLCYFRGSGLWFGLLVGVAAAVKLSPLAFLLLLAVDPSVRGRSAGGLLGLGAFALLVGGPALLRPDLFASWRDGLALMDENRGLFNPSGWSLAKDVADIAGAGGWLAIGLYGVLLGASAGAAAVLVRRARATEDVHAKRRLLLAGAILVFAVAAPRMKDYGWVFAIPAAYTAIVSWRGPAWGWLMALVVLSMDWRYLPGIAEAGRLLWAYQPWVTGAVALCLLLDTRVGEGGGRAAFALPPKAENRGDGSINSE